MECTRRFEACAWMLYLGDWVENALDRLMVPNNLTMTQGRVLRLLAARPGAGPGEVARVINRDESTTTGILKRLEARGLVARATNEADRRQSCIWLTDEGEGMIRVFHRELLSLPVFEAMRSVGDGDLEVVLGFYKTIAEHSSLSDFAELVRFYSDELHAPPGAGCSGKEESLC